MPTNNPRINITFEAATATLLAELAKKNHKSIAGMAKELVLEALERREDMVFSAIAEVRDVKSAKRVKHNDAWK